MTASFCNEFFFPLKCAFNVANKNLSKGCVEWEIYGKSEISGRKRKKTETQEMTHFHYNFVMKYESSEG